MPRHAAIIGVFIVLVLSAAGCGRQKTGVVARVNQRSITQRQLWRSLEMDEDGEAGRRALDRLIVHQLIRGEAKKRGLEATREEIQRRIDGIKDYRLAYTGKDFESWLADTGQSEEDVASRVSIQILTAKLVLTDDDREKYFDENMDRLKELPHNNESVIYRQIVLASREEADAVYKELTAGEGEPADFAEVAKARSLDPVTRARGGMAGWMIKDKSRDPTLEEVLFSLEVGEISQPLPFSPPAPPQAEDEGAEEEVPEQSPPQWWRVVRVDKHVPPHEITLEDNADVIEDWMLNEPQFQYQFHEFLSSLRARADVEILAPRYRAIGEAYRRSREARERRLAAPTQALPVLPGAAGQPPTPAQGGETPEPAEK